MRFSCGILAIAPTRRWQRRRKPINSHASVSDFRTHKLGPFLASVHTASLSRAIRTRRPKRGRSTAMAELSTASPQSANRRLPVFVITTHRGFAGPQSIMHPRCRLSCILTSAQLCLKSFTLLDENRKLPTILSSAYDWHARHSSIDRSLQPPDHLSPGVGH